MTREAQAGDLHLCGIVELGRFTLDVDLRARPGEVVALLGPNGCGKSTTLSVVAGLRRLSRGHVRIGDTVVDEPDSRTWVPAHRRRTGVVFQGLELFPHLSAADNVAYGLRRQGMDRRRAREAARGWLEVLGIGGLAAARPATLSGGQAQRVALARALAIDPAVLLLDEPMSALDARSRLDIRGELRRRLDAFPGIALLVTHDLIDVVGLADRVVVLDEGQIVQEATPEQLRRHPRSGHAAALVGRNLVRAARRGSTLDLGAGIVVPGPPGPEGAVDIVCSPVAVQVTPGDQAPPPGAWRSAVAGIESVGDHARAHLGPPVPVMARLPMAALGAGLALDSAVWVRLDPDRIEVLAAVDPPGR